MPKFAVYYVPEADHEFYQLGSKILGYDVRTRTPVAHPDKLLSHQGGFDNAWIEKAQPYGFHLTIGDAIDFEVGNLPAIASRLENLLKAFKPNNPWILTQSETPVAIMGKGKSMGLWYTPNPSLLMFHAMVVGCINTMGTGSGYLERHIKNQKTKSYYGPRIEQFYAPFILESFLPHFTLLNPYTGDQLPWLTEYFTRLFAGFKTLTVNSVCLLVQMNPAENWIIYKEFHRPL